MRCRKSNRSRVDRLLDDRSGSATTEAGVTGSASVERQRTGPSRLLKLVVAEAERWCFGHVVARCLVEARRVLGLDLDGGLDWDAAIGEQGENLVGDRGGLPA